MIGATPKELPLIIGDPQIKKDIQKLLFPHGIEYDFETGFGTVQKPETYLLINKLSEKSAKNTKMVVATRIELVTSGL